MRHQGQTHYKNYKCGNYLFKAVLCCVVYPMPNTHGGHVLKELRGTRKHITPANSPRVLEMTTSQHCSRFTVTARLGSVGCLTGWIGTSASVPSQCHRSQRQNSEPWVLPDCPSQGPSGRASYLVFPLTTGGNGIKATASST